MKLQSIARYIARIEEWLVCLLLLTMIILACTQIVLRTFFSSGLLFADGMLRYLVLWGGFLGAAMATTNGKHIALDVVSYLAPPPVKKWLQILTNLLSFLVGCGLTYASFLFIKDEFQYGGTGLLDMPTWLLYTIFPLSFTLISSRFLVLTIQSFLVAIKGKR